MNEEQQRALGSALAEYAREEVLFYRGVTSEQSVVDACIEVAKLVDSMIEEAKESNK